MTYSDVTEARDRETRLEESEARFPLPVQALTHADVGL